MDDGQSHWFLMGLQAFETQNGPKSLMEMDLWVDIFLNVQNGQSGRKKKTKQMLINLLVLFSYLRKVVHLWMDNIWFAAHQAKWWVNARFQIHSPSPTHLYQPFNFGLSSHTLWVLDPSSTNWEKENMLFRVGVKIKKNTLELSRMRQ